jgi:hypothetical protein
MLNLLKFFICSSSTTRPPFSSTTTHSVILMFASYPIWHFSVSVIKQLQLKHCLMIWWKQHV